MKNSDGEVTVTSGQQVKLEDLNKALKDYGVTIMSNDKGVKTDTPIGAFSSNVELDIDAGNIAIRVDTRDNADKAITTINSALEKVQRLRRTA